MTDVPVEIWHGAYDGSWRDLIVDEAFAHPAKMARGLIVRIYAKLFAMGALRRGDVVVDPFGGVGTTGIEGALRGVQVVSCELEPKFVELAESNYFKHLDDWMAMGVPIPTIVQGDSRQLRANLAHVWHAVRTPAAVISSPPYAAITTGAGGLNTKPAQEGQQGGRSASSPSQDTDARYGETEGQLGRLPEGEVDSVVGSPPYIDSVNAADHGIDWSKCDPASIGGRKRGDDCKHGQTLRAQLAYGAEAGQMGAMPAGDVDAIVSSPPFPQPYTGGGGINKTGYGADGADKVGERTYQALGGARADGNLETLDIGDVDAVLSSPPWGRDATGAVSGDKWASPEDFLKADRGNGASDEARLRQLERDRTKTYGEADGQLANEPMGDVDAVLTSPPYEGSLAQDSRTREALKAGMEEIHGRRYTEKSLRPAEYGATEGNVGNTTGETFWTAAHDIVRECHAILRPGGMAVWVLKAFVRKKQIVDFPGDWRRLCEHVGFEMVLEVHASLVAEHGQASLLGGPVERSERKSFFRRLAEKKGSPRIDYEVVLFMRKAATT